MSDNNMTGKGGRERPLSPHLTIYKPQITSVLSITHRATGVSLLLGLFLSVAWLGSLACDEETFNFVNGFVTSIVGKIIITCFIWAIYYHMWNGIRHLFWDIGKGYEISTVTKSGIFVVIASIALTIITLFTFL